jgi:nitrogen regulatory protein P-II 1
VKLIKAYVRTYMSDKVIHVLKEIDAPRLTAIDIRVMGDEIDPRHLEISSAHAATYTTMVKLEIVCNDDQVNKICDAIIENARTGYKGDGIVVISPVDEAIGIRSGRLSRN